MSNERTASGGVPVGRTFICFGGERIDQVAHAAYKQQAGVVEALLIANPGLAAQPYNLPKDLAIELPELVATEKAAAAEVDLWG